MLCCGIEKVEENGVKVYSYVFCTPGKMLTTLRSCRSTSQVRRIAMSFLNKVIKKELWLNVMAYYRA